EAGERIFAELETALKTDKPSIFFRNLERAGLLGVTFPEIENLRGKTQPAEFHPEGDAYEHTMQILDEVAAVNKKPVIRFAALAHDFGKGTTPLEMLPHHYKHDLRGLDVLNEMDRRIHLPKDWKKIAAFVIKEHMRAPVMTAPGKIVELLIKLSKLKIVKDFADIINADHHGLPTYLADAEKILPELLKITGRDVPPEIHGEKIGEYIFQARIRKFIEIYRQF
ncbi:MAG: HD domain-containing protein, partial [Selenomonadaceae bacterium]|nr:HD domain-containing protein [Selenomonadaceae bacterium]